MSVMKFRLKMDAPSRLSVEMNLNPLFSRSLLCEDRERYIRFTNERCCEGVSVADSNVHLVCKHVGFDLHKLKCPRGIFSTMLANLGSPLLVADLNNDEGIHLVKRTAEVALQVR